jgi:Glycogen recognition site of AMP-activated protein kinase
MGGSVSRQDGGEPGTPPQGQDEIQDVPETPPTMLGSIGPSAPSGTDSSSAAASAAASRNLDIGGGDGDYNHSRAGSSLGSIVPTIFTWAFAGHTVYVTGAWDNWRAKVPLSRNGNEHSAVLSLPVGTYQFKFIVDGNWKHSSALSTETDQHGNLNNIVAVSPHLPEYDSNAPPSGGGGPPSPVESYDFSMPQHEDYTVEPMVLPTLFKAAPVSRNVAEGAPLNPSAYVTINHLYDAAADFATDPIKTMATVVRYKANKFVTSVMITNASASTQPPGQAALTPHSTNQSEFTQHLLLHQRQPQAGPQLQPRHPVQQVQGQQQPHPYPSQPTAVVAIPEPVLTDHPPQHML